jgi:hypothetical protein
MVAMATWEDGPEYAPLVRPDAFNEPTTPPLSVAPAVEQPAAAAPKERPGFADPAAPVAPLEDLVPPIEAPRDPAVPFNVVTTALTSADSAWGAAHWARQSSPTGGPWPASPSDPAGGPWPALPSDPAGGGPWPASPSGQDASPWPVPTQPLIPAAGPPPTANGFPAPGTAAWFTPPPLPQPAANTPVTAKRVLGAVTPGVYITLAIGGLVYLISPIMLAVAFALSSRMEVAAQHARRAFVTAFFVVGFFAVVGILNLPASFGDWWSSVGLWSLITCWLVLLAVSLSVYSELKRRVADQPPPPAPWG